MVHLTSFDSIRGMHEDVAVFIINLIYALNFLRGVQRPEPLVIIFRP